MVRTKPRTEWPPPGPMHIRHLSLPLARRILLITLRSFPSLIAALFAGAAILYPLPSLAGSCCGGGSGTSLLLPRIYQGMIDVSVDTEIYHGYWDLNGKVKSDPPESDLRQYRLNIGYARRLAERW